MAGLRDDKQRGAALREHLDRALQHIHDYAVVLIDGQGRIAGWNLGAERVLGYPETQALGTALDVLFTPEDRVAGIPQRELALAERTGQAKDERWHLRGDGSRFFASGTLVAVRDDVGALLGFVKIFRDLTEHRYAVEQLAASESRYRLLVNSIKDYAIFMLDAEGRVNYWTRAAERIKGYTPDQIIGKPFATFFTEQDRIDGVPERELQAARQNGRVEGSGWRVRQDGSLFWGEEIATALHDGSGAFVGYSKITRDITERREGELERERLLREATEANRIKDEFLGTISHELRTPLNAILGWLQLLRHRNEVPDSLSEGLAVIERNARAQGRLIEDLLDVSRIVSGKATFRPSVITFAEPLAAALETVKPEAFRKRIELDVHHDVADDYVCADPERLQQIIWNLLSNAIKFTPQGGTITVSTTARAEAIEMRISDTGVGIDPAFVPLVFERFRQADTSQNRQHGGLGLGLSIVKHLVELHGGDIAVESPGPGQGTTVRLRLPRMRGHGEPTVRSRQASPSKGSPSNLTGVALLVVEDDADARRMLELVLAAQGAQVSVAATTSDALVSATSTRPDAVLSDVGMPVEDGFALLSKFRGHPTLHDVPIVAITAHASGDDRARMMAAGFDAFVPKPLDMNCVIDVIIELTASRTGRGATSDRTGS